jgi:hypothetical protein
VLIHERVLKDPLGGSLRVVKELFGIGADDGLLTSFLLGWDRRASLIVDNHAKRRTNLDQFLDYRVTDIQGAVEHESSFSAQHEGCHFCDMDATE